MKVWFSDGDPPGGRVTVSRRIHPGGQQLEVDALVGSCLLEPFDQERHEGFHLIRTENLLWGYFFSKPSKWQSLFFTEGESIKNCRELVSPKLHGMCVWNSLWIPL